MSRPIYEPSLPRADAENAYGNRQLFRRPAPASESTTPDWALLAIPDGQTVESDSLDVVVDYNRSETSGTSLTVNAAAGLITIVEEGIYNIHSWAEFDDMGDWVIWEGPVFQGGQDFQDIGNGLHVHNTGAGFTIDSTIRQHSTTIVAVDVGGVAPTGINLQVAHVRGIDDFLVNGGLTVVKIGNYPGV